MRALILGLLVGMLILSPSVLTLFGWDFLSNSPLTPGYQKIHPLLPFFVVTGAAAVITGRATYLLRSVRASGAFWAFGAVLVLVLAAQIVAQRSGVVQSGSGGVFSLLLVTLIMPMFVIASFAWLWPQDLRLLEIAVRGVMVINSLISLYEQVSGKLVLPRVLEGQSTFYGWRSIGLFGHPLVSAMMTGLVLLALILRERGNLVRRLPEIGLHTLAIFTFGGRTAMVAVVFLVVLRALMLGREAFVTGRLPAGLVRYGLGGVAALSLGSLVLSLPFVQTALSRFSNDAGSADTRLGGYELLRSLPWRSLLYGVSPTDQAALFERFTGSAPIEDAWGSWLLIFGLLAALPMTLALIYMLFRLSRRLEPEANYLVIFFLISVTAALSIGSKSLQLSLFLIVLMATCWPRGAAAVAARPRPADRPPLMPANSVGAGHGAAA